MARRGNRSSELQDDEAGLDKLMNMSPDIVDRELKHRDSLLDIIMKPFQKDLTVSEEKFPIQQRPQIPKCILSEEELNVAVDKIIREKSPKQRVMDLYFEDQMGNLPEERLCLTFIPMFGMGMGMLSNSRLISRYYSEEFIKNNRTTVWVSINQANRKHTDYVMLKSLQYGFKRGLKLAVTSTALSVLYLSLEAYMGRSVYWSGGLATAIIGGAYRLHLGLRGVIAGSILLGVPGSVIGVVGTALRKHYNLTYEDNLRDKTKQMVMDLNALQQLEKSRPLEGEIADRFPIDRT